MRKSKTWERPTILSLFSVVLLATAALALLGGLSMRASAQGPSTTTVTCAPATFVVTKTTTCTATVTGASPTGRVVWGTDTTGVFSPSTGTCDLSSGACSIGFTPSMPFSNVKITADYQGDSGNAPSSGDFTISIVRADPNVTVTCSPPALGLASPITCTATVTGASPSGTITWQSSRGTDFAPANSCLLTDGSCSVDFTPSDTALATTITAAFPGGADDNPAKGAFVLSAATSSSATLSSSSSSSVVAASSSRSQTESTVSSTVQSTTCCSSSAPEFIGIVAVVTVLLAVGWLATSRRRGSRLGSSPS